jgi:hypothetical protein
LYIDALVKAALLAAVREATEAVVVEPLSVVGIEGRCSGDLDRAEGVGELLVVGLSFNETYCGIMRGGVAVPLGIDVSELARS